MLLLRSPVTDRLLGGRGYCPALAPENTSSEQRCHCKGEGKVFFIKYYAGTYKKKIMMCKVKSFIINIPIFHKKQTKQKKTRFVHFDFMVTLLSIINNYQK